MSLIRFTKKTCFIIKLTILILYIINVITFYITLVKLSVD
jgi:hypothetical protein